MEKTNTTKDRLKNKLKKKKEARAKKTNEEKMDKTDNTSKTGIPELDNEPGGDIFQMINQVQNMLKTNPEMVSKVSNCINSLMGNPEIMQQIIQSQTLETSLSDDNSEAVSKES